MSTARHNTIEKGPSRSPSAICTDVTRGWGRAGCGLGPDTWAHTLDSTPLGAFPGSVLPAPMDQQGPTQPALARATCLGLRTHHALLPDHRHALLHAVGALGDEGEVVFADSLLGGGEGAVGAAGHLEIPAGSKWVSQQGPAGPGLP